MKLFKRKLQITAFILRFVRISTACWFTRPRLNQNATVQATSLNQRETMVKRHHGFTLVELLIVIALMAILWRTPCFINRKRYFPYLTTN